MKMMMIWVPEPEGPVLRRHVHMWISSCQYICKSSHSWILNSSGSQRNYFSANVFIYVFPHFYPVCFFFFFQWIDMNNMVATCIGHEREPTFGNLKM